MEDKVSRVLGLIVLLGLTIGTYTQNIDPRCAIEIAYSTTMIIKSTSKH